METNQRKTMFKVTPFALDGELEVPASKSFLQRAAVCASLARGKTTLFRPIYSQDVLSLLESLKNLGTHVVMLEDRVEIDGISTFSKKSGVLVAGESGFNARVLSVLASVALETTRTSWCITGYGTLLQRSMHSLFETFRAARIEFESFSDVLPFWIFSPPKKTAFIVDVSQTSQVLSGMLLSFPALTSYEKFVIYAQNEVSQPYIELTLDVLEKFNVKITREDGGVYHISCNQRYAPVHLTVEGDWSHASLWMVAAVLGGKLSLSGLSLTSHQGDKIFLQWLQELGIHVNHENNVVSVEMSDYPAFHVNITHHPDLAPALTLLALRTRGTSCIEGVQRLRNKESDRFKALLSFLKQLEVPFDTEINKVCIRGGKFSFPDQVEVPPDHRMVMMAILAGVLANKSYVVPNLTSITKSYPLFIHDLMKVAR
jgi:3-phosphoshikimate 1-carboxyvinyltransferase